MVTIIKGGKTIMIGPNEISNIDSTYDGVLVRCADQTEIKFNFIAPKGLNALMNVANKCVDKDIKINLDAAMRDDLSHVLTIGSNNFDNIKNNKSSEVVNRNDITSVKPAVLPELPNKSLGCDTTTCVGVIG